MRTTPILSATLVLCLGLCGMQAMATPDVRVVGLFSGKAVVMIDGQQRVLRAGEPGPQGVRLIEANSEVAVLEVEGERITARLDGRVTRRSRPAARKEVQVFRNERGLYTTVGAINGLTVPFLVDTGASTVAMNSAQARRLGIDFRVDGEPATVVTASGYAEAWKVKLRSVKVGALEVKGVDAVVIDGDQPATTLLGMSYLNRLEIDNDGQFMTLRLKY